MPQLLKNVFFFFNNGKSIFHPSFAKTAGVVWHKYSKNISTSKRLPNSSKKGKATGKKDKPLKIFFLKWKHLCNFSFPLQALLCPLEVKNTKALFQVDSWAMV